MRLCEDVVQADHIAFHTGYFNDTDNFPDAADKSADLHDKIESGTHLLSDGFDGVVDTGHADHVLNTTQSVSG